MGPSLSSDDGSGEEPFTKSEMTPPHISGGIGNSRNSSPDIESLEVEPTKKWAVQRSERTGDTSTFERPGSKSESDRSNVLELSVMSTERRIRLSTLVGQIKSMGLPSLPSDSSESDESELGESV